MTADRPSNSSFDRTRRMLLAVAASTGVLSLSRSALASDGRDGGSDAPDSDSDGDESPHREWPMVGFGPTHTFHQYQTTGPSERLRLAWQYDGVRGVPIVADGVAYLEGRRHDNPTDNHELHAVELRTRERKWWAEIPGRILSEPAVADRTVYVTSEDEGVFALDAATGDVRWQYGINEDVYGIAPPTVADDTVYVPYDGRILALTPDGERRWSRYSEFNRRFPVAVGHGLVFAAYDGERSHCDRGPGVWALNAETGERAWTYPRSDHEAENACGFVAIPPVVADGTVYTCVQTDADDYWDLTALDATTGEKRWDRPVEGGIFGTIAVANRTVYVPLTQRLLAVDSETGDSRWEYRIEIPDHVLAHEFAFSTPTVADGTVYFGTQDGRIHALDAPTGEHRCTYALGDQFDLRRPPTVTDGTVYVTGTYDADQHRQPDDMHLFALRESGDASVTADFEMKRSHWDISGQSDHFRAGYEMGFYGALSTGPISKYEWDLTDDGTVDATGRLVTYTYEEVGSKTVTLRVTGETGATDAVSKSFYVTD